MKEQYTPKELTTLKDISKKGVNRGDLVNIVHEVTADGGKKVKLITPGVYDRVLNNHVILVEPVLTNIRGHPGFSFTYYSGVENRFVLTSGSATEDGFIDDKEKNEFRNWLVTYNLISNDSLVRAA